MKIKTKDLTGAALDWAVAKCQPFFGDIQIEGCVWWKELPYLPSTDWAQGGPIIDREGILLRPIRKPGHEMHGQCLAAYDDGNTGTIVQWVKRTDWHRHYWRGPTALVAAMRCFVARKLGDEVDVPEELVA